MRSKNTECKHENTGFKTVFLIKLILTYMKNVILIIGHGACGKSSLVRALTGVARRSRNGIRDINGEDLKFNIWIRSAQEAWKSPANVLKEVNECAGPNVLLTLRFHKYNKQPEGKEYVDLLKKHHNVSKIIFLSAHEIPVSFPFPEGETESIGNAWENPVNANASIAREFLGWV